MRVLSAKAQRGLGLAVMMVILGLAAILIFTALDDNIVFFYAPSELIEKPQDDSRIRVGGLVAEDSVRIVGSWAFFDITDGEATITIGYDGILPDLFRVGQGIVAEGIYDGKIFTADTVLAKHDETYMPAEVVKTLKNKGVWKPQ